MEKTALGKRGPSVSRFGLGTMSLLTSQDAKEASGLVHQALDCGINLIDTADVYDNGAVEEALGELFAAVATTWSWPPRSACR